MSLPRCPTNLRAHWVTDDHGELVLACTPTTPDDLARDAKENRIALLVLGGGVIVYLILLCGILLIKKFQHNHVGKNKRIAHAYPYSLFAPRQSRSEVDAI
jgi:hypothetical protein